MLLSVWITHPPCYYWVSIFLLELFRISWKPKMHSLFRPCLFWLYLCETPVWMLCIVTPLPMSDQNRLDNRLPVKAHYSELLEEIKNIWSPEPKALGCISLSGLCFVSLFGSAGIWFFFEFQIYSKCVIDEASVFWHVDKNCSMLRLTLGWPCDNYAAYIL